MSHLQAAPANRAVPNGVDEIHHDAVAALPLRARHELAWGAKVYYEVVALLHARPLSRWLWLGYLCVALPVMALCAGLLDGPWAAGFAFAVLLLGVATTWLVMLPPRLLERMRRQVAPAVSSDGDNHEVAVASPESAIAWCGYILIAASVIGSSFGLADAPAAALVGFALLLLGFAFISIAMLPLRPMERFLREENRAVRNGNGQGVAPTPRADGMDWTGYFYVAASVVLATWVGLFEGPAAAFFAFTLLLIGVVFITMAMRALAKPKMV